MASEVTGAVGHKRRRPDEDASAAAPASAAAQPHPDDLLAAALADDDAWLDAALEEYGANEDGADGGDAGGEDGAASERGHAGGGMGDIAGGGFDVSQLVDAVFEDSSRQFHASHGKAAPAGGAGVGMVPPTRHVTVPSGAVSTPSPPAVDRTPPAAVAAHPTHLGERDDAPAAGHASKRARVRDADESAATDRLTEGEGGWGDRAVATAMDDGVGGAGGGDGDADSAGGGGGGGGGSWEGDLVYVARLASRLGGEGNTQALERAVRVVGRTAADDMLQETLAIEVRGVGVGEGVG
jgi:hypothetical protein